MVMMMMTLTCLRRSKHMIPRAKQAHACAGIMNEGVEYARGVAWESNEACKACGTVNQRDGWYG